MNAKMKKFLTSLLEILLNMLRPSLHRLEKKTFIVPLEMNGWSKRSLRRYGLNTRNNFKPEFQKAVALVLITSSPINTVKTQCTCVTTPRQFACLKVHPSVIWTGENRIGVHNCQKTGERGKWDHIFVAIAQDFIVLSLKGLFALISNEITPVSFDYLCVVLCFITQIKFQLKGV